MAFAVEGIDHVEVFVRDLDAAARWYEQVLGLKEMARWDPEPVMIGAGGNKLALFQGGSPAARHEGAGIASPGAPTRPASRQRRTTCGPWASNIKARWITRQRGRCTSRTLTGIGWKSPITNSAEPFCPRCNLRMGGV